MESKLYKASSNQSTFFISRWNLLKLASAFDIKVLEFAVWDFIVSLHGDWEKRVYSYSIYQDAVTIVIVLKLLEACG